jgi:hypothetical protein
VLSTAIVIGVGVIVLAGYFLPAITTVRFILLRAGLVLAAVALLVGIINLVGIHLRKLSTDQPNSGYSLILVIALAITLVVGTVDMVQTYMFGKPNFQMIKWVFTYIHLPIETSLMAVTAVSLIYAAANILRERLNVFSIVFFFVIILVLLTSFSISSNLLPILQSARNWLVGVPALAGGRGLLIGIALGSIATGLRILTGIDRPYGG